MDGEHTNLGGTVTIGGDLVVHRLGYGTMRLTGTGMWGEFPDREHGLAVLRAIVDTGVNFFDTADAYGPHTNETLIHDALYPYPEDLVIATKGGFIRGGPDYADFGVVGNREYLRQCAHLSVRRLGVERIDLYYLHSPHAKDAPFEQQITTLAQLREEGLIRHIGLSNVSVAQFESARQIVDIAAVTALYNVCERDGADLLGAAEAAGVVFSPWHPRTVTSERGDSPRVAEVLHPICQRHEASMPQIAIAWLLHRSPLILPIPGTSDLDHFRENVRAADIDLSADEVERITELVPETGPAVDADAPR